MTFGLLAIGLVLVYRSNRFLNLAHGQLGAVPALVLAKLVLDDGWNWWAAFGVCVTLGITIAVIVDRFVIRPLRERSASPVSLLLVTIGVTQLLIGVASLKWVSPNPNKLVSHNYPLPFRTTAHVGGVTLNSADLCVAVGVPVIVLGLAIFLKATILGKTIRAAADNPDAARLSGVSTRRVSIVTWAIAGALSATTAILNAPHQSTGGQGSLGPYLLFVALGASALAAFTSIPLAMVGGLLLGVANQVTLAETSNSSDGELVLVLLVVAIVLVRGRAIGAAFATSGGLSEDRAPLRIPERVRNLAWVRYPMPMVVAGACFVALLVPLVPVLSSEAHRFELALIVVYALVAVSLTVAVGWAGQVSLGQFAFVGAGAFVSAHLLGHGWSLPFVLLPAALVGAVLAVITGLPALRVPGLTLVVTTLGFALLARDWLFRQDWIGTKEQFGIIVDPPSLGTGLGRPTGHLVTYYFGCLLLLGVALALLAVRKAQPGRLIVAVRDNESAVAAFGMTPATVKIAALALAGAVAAAAGVLWTDAYRNVTGYQFDAAYSLPLLALPVIGGLGSVGGAVTAAVLFYSASFFVAPHLSDVFGSVGASLGFQLIVGGLALVVTVLKAPQGLAGAAQSWWQRRLDVAAERPLPTSQPSAPRNLEVREARLTFGGITALNNASIDVRPGEIVGLIGPNGAGKTTLINVISGAATPDSGQILLGDVDLTSLPPELRAAFGLGRSFQDARLFPGLTATETVKVAMASRYRTSLIAAALGAPWSRLAEQRGDRAAREIIERFGLTPFADTLTGELSTGTRRICELAAQVAAKPQVLLLDEPTAGVAQREAEAFGPLLRRIRGELDCAILIVEHDMPLLMGLCDRVYALEAGAVIAEGTPDEIRSNPRVIASYLGTDAAAVARSGARTVPPNSNGDSTPGAAPSAGDTVVRSRSRQATESKRAPTRTRTPK
jgi:ABC-type branched-subunit amino acid transport system ATPase component/ABC-type branched-subunit amino acid transport system permease subunit